MKTSSKFLIAALCGLTILAPSVAALVGTAGLHEVACVPQDDSGSASVFIPPAGLATNFNPVCVTIANGGTVTFTNLDAIPHGAAKNGCFELGRMPTQGTQSLTLTIADELLGILQNGEDGGACDGFTIEQDALGNSYAEVVYQCVVHGAAMTASIRIDL